MNIVQSLAMAIVLGGLFSSINSAAQTGSYWQGVIDANIPVDFYAERFTGKTIEGRLRFAQARYGFADINRLCDAANLKATRRGEHYVYRITGRCGGKGTLRVPHANPDRIEGRGTIYDAASASGNKRRHFYLLRE